MAWLVTAYEFRGRGVLEWALLLPLAIPTYIAAYAYLDILHPVGAVQGWLRALLGYGVRAISACRMSAPWAGASCSWASCFTLTSI